MYLFLIVLFLLYGFSLIKPYRENFYVLTKDRTIGLKGLLSICIITFHLQAGVDLSVLSLFNSWGAPVVSLFFFLSGYGLMYSYIKKGKRYLDGFVRQRLWKILEPFFIVMLLFVLLNSLDEGYVMFPTWEDIICKGRMPLPYSWFVVAIIIQYLLFYFSFSLDKIAIKYKIVLVFLLTIVIMVLMKAVGYERAWWVSSLAFPIGLVYCYKESYWNIVFRRKIWKIALIPIGSILIFIVVLSKIEILFALVYVLIPLMIIYLISYMGGLQNKYLMLLGEISYETYLFHGVAINLLRGKHIYILSDCLYVSFVYILTLLLAFMLHKGLRVIKK